MHTPAPCPRCGSTDLASGRLVNDAGFKPDDLRGFHLTGILSVQAHACAACGHLQLQVDPRKLAAMLER